MMAPEESGGSHRIIIKQNGNGEMEIRSCGGPLSSWRVENAICLASRDNGTIDEDAPDFDAALDEALLRLT